jgi:hypothetical protein
LIEKKHGIGYTIFSNRVVIGKGIMIIENKRAKLHDIYNDFESSVQIYKAGAICKIGCAFCCIHFGNVDIITLEGFIIHEWIEGLDKTDKADFRKRIVKNMKKKVKRSITRCPFLNTDNTCLIYDIRPFSCRQLYSLRECTDRGPTVHRQAVQKTKKTVKKLQQLDSTGYSGHISYILHLFDKPDFKELYRSGGFNPGHIMAFGKKHGIVINQKACEHEIQP